MNQGNEDGDMQSLYMQEPRDIAKIFRASTFPD